MESQEQVKLWCWVAHCRWSPKDHQVLRLRPSPSGKESARILQQWKVKELCWEKKLYIVRFPNPLLLKASQMGNLTRKKCVNFTLPSPPPTRQRWPSQRNIPICPSVRPAKKKVFFSFLSFVHQLKSNQVTGKLDLEKKLTWRPQMSSLQQEQKIEPTRSSLKMPARM